MLPILVKNEDKVDSSIRETGSRGRIKKIGENKMTYN